MKRIGWMLGAALLLLAGPATAQEIAGVAVAPTVTVQGRTLHHNGSGLREKLFFDIYLGSLYTEQPVSTTAAALATPGAKLIRMHFLYRKVDREKIVAAFAEGLEKNAPQLLDSTASKAFLGWFVHDFVRGDVVDLELAADGTVAARHNGTLLGRLHSPELARGVLLIYLGDQPADADLKAGMLGRG